VSSTIWRLFDLSFWGRECLVAGVSFSSTNSVVSARSNIYELARWIEGKIDLSLTGIGPSIDHGAYFHSKN
jgi:hypothetical protein